MKTNWMTWSLGGLIALALAASASAGVTRHKTKPPGPDMVNILIRQLQDPDFTVRRGAARGLGRIGSRAGKALPALLEALKDAHPQVHAAAELALGRIAETAQQDLPGALRAATIVPRDPSFGGRMR